MGEISMSTTWLPQHVENSLIFYLFTYFYVERSTMTQFRLKNGVTLPDETFLADVCRICRRRMHTNSPRLLQGFLVSLDRSC